MSVEGAKPGGHHGAQRKHQSGFPVGCPVVEIGRRSHERSKDNSHEARTMGLVLGQFDESRHDRDHDDTPAKPDKTPKETPKYTYYKADNPFQSNYSNFASLGPRSPQDGQRVTEPGAETADVSA